MVSNTESVMARPRRNAAKKKPGENRACIPSLYPFFWPDEPRRESPPSPIRTHPTTFWHASGRSFRSLGPLVPFGPLFPVLVHSPCRQGLKYRRAALRIFPQPTPMATIQTIAGEDGQPHPDLALVDRVRGGRHLRLRYAGAQVRAAGLPDRAAHHAEPRRCRRRNAGRVSQGL